jgi:DNA-binding winged helix-turn-helix (wHTH) protein/TolB-like protein
VDEIRIGAHVLQPNRQLLVGGKHVHLGPRALAILTVLAEADGEIVTKDELMEAVWPDVTVEENALQVHVTALRKALGEDAGRLHTLRGIGYQLKTGEEPVRKAAGESEAVGDGPSTQDTTFGKALQSKARRPALVAAALVALLIVAVHGSIVAFGPSDEVTAHEQAPTVLAVLPFQVSGDEEWQERGEALNASLSSNLARVPNIEFVSSTAARAVANHELSPFQIGAQLGVDHFIEGDVHATGSQLTGLVRLVDASTGRAIWSDEIAGQKKFPDEFEALLLNRLSGVFIALHMVANGEVEIPEDIDPRAYEAFLDGLARLTLVSWRDSAQLLRQMQVAVSIEPDFAAAHAGVAYALAYGSNASFPTLSREEYLALQEEASARALELDPDNFMAQLANAQVRLEAHGDITAALESSDRLLKLRPDDRHAHFFRSNTLDLAGQLNEAAIHLDRAIAADPFNYQLPYYQRYIMSGLNDYSAVKRSALSCRVDCWFAALQWWGVLLKIGSRMDYEADIDLIAEMYDDDRSFYSGDAEPAQSLRSHAEFIFLDRPNPYMRGFHDDKEAAGFNDWTLMVFKYGYVDAGFEIAKRRIDIWPSSYILSFTRAGRLKLSEEIRADPRYNAIFEIPRYKALADYWRERGLTEGLPVLPLKSYPQN